MRSATTALRLAPQASTALRFDRRQSFCLATLALLISACSTVQAPPPTTPSPSAPKVYALPKAAPTKAEPPPTAVAAPKAKSTPIKSTPPAVASHSSTPTPSADAVPRTEPLDDFANRPYSIQGENYHPWPTDVAIFEIGTASWYGEPFHGRKTANGERYDMHLMTAAHKTMPLPSYAMVRNVANGRQVIVRVNDRGPFKPNRIIDLSLAAAKRLGIQGLGKVEVRRLTQADIRTGAWKTLQPITVAGPDKQSD